MGGCSRGHHQPAGAGDDFAGGRRLWLWCDGVAPLPSANSSVGTSPGTNNRHRAGPAHLAAKHSGQFAKRCAPACGRRACCPTWPGLHPLSGGPAGHARDVGHIPGHGGHAQRCGVCTGRRLQRSGHARCVFRAHQRPGPGFWHFGRWRSHLGHAGVDVQPGAPRTRPRRTPAGQVDGPATAHFFAHAPASGNLQSPAAAIPGSASGGRAAEHAHGPRGATQPAAGRESAHTTRQFPPRR